MSINASDCSKQLENHMENMCHYLEKLVTSDDGDEDHESNYHHNVDPTHVFPGPSGLQKQKPQTYIPGGFNFEPRASVVPDVRPTSFNFGLMGAPHQNAPNMVTSVLANDANLSNCTPKFVSNPNAHPKMKKRVNYKESEMDPDISGIDIEATMKELGLTPESLTQNKVHKLFSLFSDLEFSIHAEYITTTVFDQKTIPNTLSVSAQTKYAVWSNHKLLRSLREVLKRPMPAEYKSVFKKCEEALGELEQAISSLDRFKNCTLEHRRGNFITPEAEEYLQPLMAVLNHLIGCVEKSRMYIQIYERALNCPERYKAALLNSCEEHPQPAPVESYPEIASSSRPRPEMARRYIG